jgi:hypothetical protein
MFSVLSMTYDSPPEISLRGAQILTVCNADELEFRL